MAAEVRASPTMEEFWILLSMLKVKFQNNSKTLDPSYVNDLHVIFFLGCSGKGKQNCFIIT